MAYLLAWLRNSTSFGLTLALMRKLRMSMCRLYSLKFCRHQHRLHWFPCFWHYYWYLTFTKKVLMLKNHFKWCTQTHTIDNILNSHFGCIDTILLLKGAEAQSISSFQSEEHPENRWTLERIFIRIDTEINNTRNVEDWQYLKVIRKHL